MFVWSLVPRLGININTWSRLMHDYVRNPINNAGDTEQERAYVRGNIIKDFTRPSMTWKTFIKCMRFIQISKLSISISFYRKTANAPIVLTLPIDFGIDEETSVWNTIDDDAMSDLETDNLCRIAELQKYLQNSPEALRQFILLKDRLEESQKKRDQE